MNTFSAESLAAALAIIGIVIIVSALLSGLIERSGLPQVAVFLALGVARSGDFESRARALYGRRIAQYRRSEAPRRAGAPVTRAGYAAYRRPHCARRMVGTGASGAWGRDPRRGARFQRPGAVARASSPP